MNEDDLVDVDLLVIGGGMAGLSAAASAAAAGATVLVAEKGPEVGGSAVLSGGGVWTAHTFEVLSEVNPSGDLVRGRVLIEDYESAVEFVRSLGVSVSKPVRTDSIMGFPAVSHRVDIYSYIQRCKSIVESHGGWVICGTTVDRLIFEDGAVVGASLRGRDGTDDIRARYTLLATGGFQADAELRKDLIGEHAVGAVVRSNPHSTGDGLRLATSVGGAISSATDSFYGHTIATPLNKEFVPGDYVRLAQIYSPRAILLGRDGCRFTDDSLSYYKNAQAVSRQPGGRALLVGDQQVRDDDAAMYGPGVEVLDRLEEAVNAGAHGLVAATEAELEEAVASWGYRNVAAGIAAYNRAVDGEDGPVDTPRRRNRRPFKAPFFALEVTAAITFPFRGICVDADSRVLDDTGAVIPGLLAAGADAGGLYEETYAGGLSMSLVFGISSARTALAAAVVDR